MNTSTAKEYIASIERRHNMSAEDRSLGKHHGLCDGHPCHPESATSVGPNECVPVRQGASGMAGKGGRGKGQDAKSNYGPSGESDGDGY